MSTKPIHHPGSVGWRGTHLHTYVHTPLQKSLHSTNGKYYIHYTSTSPLFFYDTNYHDFHHHQVDSWYYDIISSVSLQPPPFPSLSLPVAHCGAPPGPGPDGLVDFTDTTFGSSVTYTCTTTCYGLVPNTPTRTCMENSEWSGDDPTCQCKSVMQSFVWPPNFQLEYIQFSLSCWLWSSSGHSGLLCNTHKNWLWLWSHLCGWAWQHSHWRCNTHMWSRWKLEWRPRSSISTVSQQYVWCYYNIAIMANLTVSFLSFLF